MRILDIQNLQLSHNNFYISINDLNLENDVSYIETSITLYFNFSHTEHITELIFVSFPQKRNGIVFSSGVNYLHRTELTPPTPRSDEGPDNSGN